MNVPRYIGRHGSMLIYRVDGALRYVLDGEKVFAKAPGRKSPDFVGPRRPDGVRGPARMR